jgi:hypothetical protein
MEHKQTKLVQPLSATQAMTLESFLKSRFHSDEAADKTLHYRAASVLLHDVDPPEIVAYVEGDGWCGTAGCALIVLKTDNDVLSVLTKLTVIQLPVRVLPHLTNGWHDIGVLIHNGPYGDEGTLKFNGKRYTSPSIQHGHVRRTGVTLFTYDSVSTALYR